MGLVKMYPTIAPIGGISIAGVEVEKEGDAFLVPAEHAAEVAATFGLGFEPVAVQVEQAHAVTPPAAPEQPAHRVIADDVSDAAAGEAPVGPRKGRR